MYVACLKPARSGKADKACGGGPSITDSQIRTHTHTHTFVVESFKVPEPQASQCDEGAGRALRRLWEGVCKLIRTAR